MASGSEEGSGFPIDDYDSLIVTTDVELLKRAWRNEKAAPEILQFQTALVQRSREQIQLMEDTAEEFAESGRDPLTVSLYQMDLDRMQFLLRSYLRIRLQKHLKSEIGPRLEEVITENWALTTNDNNEIEKNMIHILKTELWNRLSEQEQKFAKRCTDDIEKHLNQSVLSKLPSEYQSILKQSIISEEDDMVPEPRLDTFVFCKSKGSGGTFQLDESGEIVDLFADDLYILRYNSIKPLVESGQVDLV